jgi:two-component system chemotaxis response regulator CheB
MKRIRVLIVDDSATMRGLIAMVLRQDPQIEVVGEAGDPMQARMAIKTLNPDVLTLDVEMPKMNGLEFLEKIMQLRPMPVIMVSNRTSREALATIEALEIGAFDCIPKPGSGDEEGFAELIAKVKAAAGSKVQRHVPKIRADQREAVPKSGVSDYRPGSRVVAIGASTGGVEALISVLSKFPHNCPATIITQHMPAAFTASFAKRLDRLCAPSVSEAIDGAMLEPGRVFLAPGGATHLEIINAGNLRCRLRKSDLVNGHRPSVDVLFHSLAKAVGSNALGVILTGMGRDGAAGLVAMREAGARTIGQDEATSLVYGMPKSAFEIGAIEKQMPLNKIGLEILRLTYLEGEDRCRSLQL